MMFAAIVQGCTVIPTAVSTVTLVGPTPSLLVPAAAPAGGPVPTPTLAPLSFHGQITAREDFLTATAPTFNGRAFAKPATVSVRMPSPPASTPGLTPEVFAAEIVWGTAPEATTSAAKAAASAAAAKVIPGVEGARWPRRTTVKAPLVPAHRPTPSLGAGRWPT